MRLIICVILSLVVPMTACSSKGGGGDTAKKDDQAPELQGKLKDLQGFWIVEDEGRELRTTGKLKRLCDEVRKYPASGVSNIRTISGEDLYIYRPGAGKAPGLKIGTISPDGLLTLTANFQQQYAATSPPQVNVESDILTLNFSSSHGQVGLDYLRSNQTEADQYFAFLETCKK